MSGETRVRLEQQANSHSDRVSALVEEVAAALGADGLEAERLAKFGGWMFREGAYYGIVTSEMAHPRKGPRPVNLESFDEW